MSSSPEIQTDIFVRQATVADLPRLSALEWPVRDGAVRAGECYVASVGGEVVGYAMFNHAFLKRAYVPIVFVQTDHRRRGVASALLTHVEGLVTQPKIWCSANAENLPMQHLLHKAGYQLSGLVHDLGHVPELIYHKRIVRPIP